MAEDWFLVFEKPTLNSSMNTGLSCDDVSLTKDYFFSFS